MHIATVGSPTAKSTVLFLHGFPELWSTWRHQLLALPTLGDYRCIAPDLRGCGDTDAPPSASKYTAFHIVGDLFRPDRVRAVVNLSIPPLRQFPGSNIVDDFRAVYGDDYYFVRFQEVGVVEAEFAQVDTGKLINKLYTLFSKPDPPIVPKEPGFKGLPESLLPWLPKETVEYYASKFSKTGFTGGLNYYRAITLTGELMGPWVGSKHQVPAKFIIGDQDVVYHMPGMKDYINGKEFKKDVPMLDKVVIMEGVPHFPQLVKPQEITQHVFDFIKRF
ncbi:Epoxide hydrolase A [Linum perenne]